MSTYINRLVKCGYTIGKARAICIDFIKNLSLIDLECFIMSVERNYYVD